MRVWSGDYPGYTRANLPGFSALDAILSVTAVTPKCLFITQLRQASVRQLSDIDSLEVRSGALALGFDLRRSM